MERETKVKTGKNLHASELRMFVSLTKPLESVQHVSDVKHNNRSTEVCRDTHISGEKHTNTAQTYRYIHRANKEKYILFRCKRLTFSFHRSCCWRSTINNSIDMPYAAFATTHSQHLCAIVPTG